MGSWSDIAVHDPARGAHGSFYVAATGDPATPAMDTVWWFDGTDRWHATGLRTNADASKRVPAPAYAVVVDKSDRNTSTSAPRSASGAASSIPARPLGLVLDEQRPAGSGRPGPRPARRKRDRPARPARGDPGARHLGGRSRPAEPRRAHAAARPRVGHATAEPDAADRSEKAAAERAPLVAREPRPARAAAPRQQAAGADGRLPWVGAAPNAYDLWVFQTALRVRGTGDPLVKPDGQWTPMFDTRLRAANANANRITQALWNSVVGSGASFPNAYAEPWSGAEPNEADLYELHPRPQRAGRRRRRRWRSAASTPGSTSRCTTAAAAPRRRARCG